MLFISLYILVQPASPRGLHNIAWHSFSIALTRADRYLFARFLQSIVNSWRGEGRPRPTFMNTEETKSWGCHGLRCRVGAAAAAAAATCTSSPRMLMPVGCRFPRLFHAKGCLFVCVRERAWASAAPLLLVIHGTLDYIAEPIHLPSCCARARNSIRSLSNCYCRIE